MPRMTDAARPVRTRFAPSPTGFMHIGGMRTALFAWLLARHDPDGQFILRIDDTDKSRNVDDALAPILDAFAWLGLDWDEGPEYTVQGRPVGGGDHGPYYQSQRGEKYAAAIEKLVASEAAYRDYESPDDTRAQREAAEKAKQNYRSSRVSLEMTLDEREAKKDEAHVVRLKVPRDRTITVVDAVRGEVSWDAADMVDPVLARGDGSPLYNLASVVDDGEMAITHIVRAEEHLSNVPVQVLLFEALGYDMPTFVHIPFVTAPGTSKKLSKREKDLEKYRQNPQFKALYQIADRTLPRLGLELDATINPVMVRFYEEVGFLPEAVLNTLARLGWSLDDKTEFLSLEEVVAAYTLDRVVKAPAGLDCDKMLDFQEQWMERVDADTKAARCGDYLTRAGIDADSGHVARVVDVLGDRIKLFSDILAFPEFFAQADAIEYDAKAWKKRITKSDTAADDLKAYAGEVDGWEGDWTAAALETHLDDFASRHDRSLGQLVHPIRVAVTGRQAGAGLFDTLALIGREQVAARLHRAIGKLDAAK